MYKFEKKNKYLVLKLEDIDKALSTSQKQELNKFIDQINGYRYEEGKKDNSYVVVNEDETYSKMIWELIKDGEDDRYIQKSMDDNSWYRASGDCACKECLKMYKEHSHGSYIFATFHILCNGDVVKT